MSDYVAKQGTTALGIIGTALGGLNALGGMNLLNNGMPYNGMVWSSDDRPVTRYELTQAQTIAAKDAEIALLKSEQNTEIKIADVYERLAKKINDNQREQDGINREQAVYNGVNTATLNCMKNSIEQLMSLTALRIPNTSVCPGWGAVTITPATPTVVATTPSGAA